MKIRQGGPDDIPLILAMLDGAVEHGEDEGDVVGAALSDLHSADANRGIRGRA
ncbi:hypothetical protein [Streptomyces sp. SBT349]|uniref:hypothetical protein n=1 Tax=Streptomyces sp. SBT349 TaxID=1580539 RepID=UPI000A7144D5|nr:hypothetical protein [Streptomyces sp. SBT349]